MIPYTSSVFIIMDFDYFLNHFSTYFQMLLLSNNLWRYCSLCSSNKPKSILSLLRKWILKDKQYEITNEILVSFGFRRLLFNPHASHPKAFVPKKTPSSLSKGD